MMMNELINYAAEIAALICVASVLAMLVSLRAHLRRGREQAELVAQLKLDVGENAKARLELYDLIGSLCEQNAQRVEHQEPVAARPPGTRRFEQATRMIKRGVGDVETLHDLGLSRGEAQLLVRLHTTPAYQKKSPEKGRALPAQARALAQLLESA